MKLCSLIQQSCKRELLLRYRQRTELIFPIAFFILVALLFPLAINPQTKTLLIIGPGVIWVAICLASLLSLPQLFQQDYADGYLEQLLLNHSSLNLQLFIKLAIHWFVFIVPLIVLTPVISMMYHLPISVLAALIATLLLGTPSLILLGAIANALTVGLKNSGLLIALLVIPFYIPILIFGAGAANAAASQLNYAGQLLWLGALLILTLTLVPATTAFALRIGINT